MTDLLIIVGCFLPLAMYFFVQYHIDPAAKRGLKVLRKKDLESATSK